MKSKDQDYKARIRQQLDWPIDQNRVIRFFQQYWINGSLAVPPWAEADRAFQRKHDHVIRRILEANSPLEIPRQDSRVAWVPVPKTTQWARLVGGQEVPLQVYFTCNLWKKGTPSEQAELAFLRSQCPVEHLFYPGEVDLGVPYGEDSAAFFHELVRTQADVFIFSELEVEFGRFIGFGVYHELLRAQWKGIPIFLLRDEQFWLNPRLTLHNRENLTCHAKVDATPHTPLKTLEEWFCFEV